VAGGRHGGGGEEVHREGGRRQRGEEWQSESGALRGEGCSRSGVQVGPYPHVRVNRREKKKTLTGGSVLA
jgi:hypothetical protein